MNVASNTLKYFVLPPKSSYCSTPVSGARGRRIQMAQMIILPFIPIVALIIQNVLSLWTVLEYQKEVGDIDKQVIKP